MSSISAEMEAELIRLFTRFDTDRSGLIDEVEFAAILDCLGYSSAAEQRNLEFAAIDTDNDGRIRFREFSNWWIDNN